MKRIIEKYAYQCLNDAREILKSIGIPTSLYNPRCVMTFAALAEMKSSDTNWAHIAENYHGTHDICEFINTNFPNKAGLDHIGYAENSRETFRDGTLKPWISAGIVEAKPGLAPNDKNNSYRFTSHFAALVRSYGTDFWQERLDDYRETHEDYSVYLKQAKHIQRNYTIDYLGNPLSFEKTRHNKLQLAIIEDLFPLISKTKPELLYIGDATNRHLVCNSDRLKALGINVLSDSSKLPDVIAYDSANNRVLFIEAFYSGGAFTIDRVSSIKALCLCKPGTEVAFITAFDTTNKMLKAYKTVAWDTDMWSADEPTHLVHKNGDKFIGRLLENPHK